MIKVSQFLHNNLIIRAGSCYYIYEQALGFLEIKPKVPLFKSAAGQKSARYTSNLCCGMDCQTITKGMKVFYLLKKRTKVTPLGSGCAGLPSCGSSLAPPLKFSILKFSFKKSNHADQVIARQSTN